ncbi:MAG: PLP-dependent aminotransferase family protein, partial [Acidimicrobiales bacterium]
MDLVTRLGPWSLGPGPLHRKLADALQAAIARGDLAPGSLLPAERSLARSLAVSRSTVVSAYDRLRGDGWIESRQGSGTRVRWAEAVPEGRRIPTGSGDVIFRRLILGPSGVEGSSGPLGGTPGPGGIVSLAAAILPGAEAVTDAVASFSREELSDLVTTSGYVPLGLLALRREIAALHTRSGLPTNERQVLITTGAQQAISLAAALLARPGDRVLVENPSFSGTLDALRTAGAHPLGVPLDEEGADVEGFSRAAAESSPAALYLMPSYHNPAGIVLSEARRRRLARLSREQGLPVIEDNALEYVRLDAAPPPPAVAAFAPDAPILTVGSLSKVLWAGLRVGWVRGSEEMIGRLVHGKVVHDLGSAVLPQAVAARLLPRLEELREERRHRLVGFVDRAGA